MESPEIPLDNANLETNEENPNVLLLIRQNDPVTLMINKLNNDYVEDEGASHSQPLHVSVPSSDINHEAGQINQSNQSWKKFDHQSSTTDTEQIQQTDAFLCGICGHTSFKILDYLQHKAQHAAPRAGICCELCNMSYTRQLTLTEHYRLKHKVIFPKENLKSSLDTVTNKSKKKSIILSEDLNQHTADVENASFKDDTNQILENVNSSDYINSSHRDASSSSPQNVELNNLDITSVKIENLQSNLTLDVEQSKKGPVTEKEFLTRETTTETYVDVEIDPNFNVLSSENLNPLSKTNDSSIDRNKDFHFILLNPQYKTSNQEFRCLHCEYKTHWKSKMCKHMNNQHSDTLSIHQAIAVLNPHPETNHKLMRMSEFTALQAKWRAESSKKRYRGIEKQDLLGTYPCTKCDKVFTRLRYLRKHSHTHRTEQKFLCDECGKAFKTQGYLNAHHKIHKRAAYCCSQCDFTSSINSAIHAHRQIHNEGSVICDVCGFAYIDKSTLMKHKRVHDPNRPYACTFQGCTWRFKTEVMCKAHFKKHTTEGKFKCSKCGYVFRHKHHLRRHEAKVHNSQPMKDKDTEETLVESKHTEDSSEVPNTVNLIVDPDIDSDQFDLQSLQNSQLVIATDEEGNTINYEVTDIAMNVAYQTLLQETEGHIGDTHTILIPQSECSQIVLQESESVMEINE